MLVGQILGLEETLAANFKQYYLNTAVQES
jgi:hypothetical protein